MQKSSLLCFHTLVMHREASNELEIRSVECGICPIAKSTIKCYNFYSATVQRDAEILAIRQLTGITLHYFLCACMKRASIYFSLKSHITIMFLV